MKSQKFPKGYFSKRYSSVIPTKEDLNKTLPKFRKALVDFINQLPKNAKVLDAGCGVGKNTKMILAFRPDVEVFAVDISDVKEFLPKKVNFQIISTEEVERIFKENFFDAIICLHVIEHLLYPMKTMENFKKILKSEGRLYLETPNWSRALFPFSSTFFWDDYTHIRIFTKIAMRNLLEDYNFEILELKTVSFSNMIIKGDSLHKAIGVYEKEGRNFFRFLKKFLMTAFLRITNPFLKDILICIAVNKK